MKYNRSQEEKLDLKLFENPEKEYRGAPFWAWNEKLDAEKLKNQVTQFADMGMGGFHMHCRVGLDTEYLGKDFFECVKTCIEEAKKENLLAYLYDEDRWPSGSAGGLVTRNHKYRIRFLVFAPAGFKQKEEASYMAAAKAVRSKERAFLGRYFVTLDEEGYLEKYKADKGKIQKPEEGEEVWEAYLEVSGDTPWFNNQAYLNTLDPKAVQRFIQMTHEKYYQECAPEFGKEILSIFTDEPQMTLKGMMDSPFDKNEIIMPFTDDFDRTFEKTYGYSLLEHLPELFWEKKVQDYQVRYHYHAHITERFSEAYGDQIGEWCDRHQIGLTGHMMNEWTLHSQTLAVGECMRPMKHFALPGVDMLCDRRELSTLKQAQSVAHQMGREGVTCEIYGVTGWDFDFRKHKLSGDWQAALGVTFRVPHLTWVSMEGEAKRDYPASIGKQSPWYREYKELETYFARLNTVLTRGKPVVQVGVIHPVESYWMYWGNREQTGLKRQVLEENFRQVIEWLLFGLVDFDFVSEGLLENLSQEKTISGKFQVGDMAYSVIVVPECHTLRHNTIKLLKNFLDNGGNVIFLGEGPQFIEGKKGLIDFQSFDACWFLPYNRQALLGKLESFRDIDVEVSAVDGNDPTRLKHIENGTRANNLFYQLREDGKDRWLFLSHVNLPVNEHIAYTEHWKIKVKGSYSAVIYDAMTGKHSNVSTAYRSGNTIVEYFSSQYDSLLLKLIPGKGNAGEKIHYLDVSEKVSEVPEPISYEVDEENVLLLDQAEFCLDDGPWQPTEELLRIDNLFREKLGYPLRMEALAQPWVVHEEEYLEHILKLKFTIFSEIERKEIDLAMEHPENAVILWNYQKIAADSDGYYVDECIKKIRLPALLKGENVLEIAIPFGKKTNIEWLYLLGAFGVEVKGRTARIIEMPGKIYYGNYVTQGLAFYGGNITYTSEINTKKGELFLEVSHYRGALMKVFLDDEEKGNLYLAPYRMSLGQVSEGKHKISIKLYGNRINTFGAVHNADASEKWYGPNLWRTTGNKWSYEYQLKETGILVSPTYWIKESEENGK